MFNKIKIITLSFAIFVVGCGIVLAWTGPTATPPSSNTAIPVNIGVNPQIKEGSLQSETDIRAPIYYDYPSTSYYVDPAGNSWLYRLYSYDVRSSIFYDRDNTSYYLNPASTSVLNGLTVSGQNVCLANGTNCPAGSDDQTLAEVLVRGNNANNYEILNVNGIRLGSASSPGGWQIYGSGNMYTAGYWRGDGGFQVDGIGVIGSDAWVEGDRIRQNTIDSGEIQNGTLTYSDTNVNSIQRRVTGTCGAGSSIRVISSTGAVTCESDTSGITSESDPQVGTLYNGYWCTSNGSSVNCTSPAPSGGITGSGSTNRIPKFTGSTSLGNSGMSDSGSLLYLQPSYGGANQEMYSNGNTYYDANIHTFRTAAGNPTGVSIRSNGLYAPIFYDSENSSYKIHPNGRSDVLGLFRQYGFDGREYDANNSSYYVDPSGLSVVSLLQVNSTLNVYSALNTYGQIYAYSILSLGGLRSSPSGPYSVVPSGTSILNTVYYSSAGVYSDRKLKKDIQKLRNPLDKVLQLEGVSFKWKDEEHGVGDNLGLIAQDVEKVYPELVLIDKETGMKTIQYENLVAPLIEAIKEQQKQIEELKSEVNILKNK